MPGLTAAPAFPPESPESLSVALPVTLTVSLAKCQLVSTAGVSVGGLRSTDNRFGVLSGPELLPARSEHSSVNAIEAFALPSAIKSLAGIEKAKLPLVPATPVYGEPAAPLTRSFALPNARPLPPSVNTALTGIELPGPNQVSAAGAVTLVSAGGLSSMFRAPACEPETLPSRSCTVTLKFTAFSSPAVATLVGSAKVQVVAVQFVATTVVAPAVSTAPAAATPAPASVNPTVTGSV